MKIVCRSVSNKYVDIKFIIGNTTISGGVYNKIELSELYEQFCESLEVLAYYLSKME